MPYTTMDLLFKLIGNVRISIEGYAMKGDKEQKCLDLLRQATFTNNGDIIYHPFYIKTYTEVDSNEFASEKIWFINSNCHKNYFGLLKKTESKSNRFYALLNPT